MDNLVITVARGFGSCGKRIAKQIADDLGIHCYENRILMLASQMSGLDEEVSSVHQTYSSLIPSYY